MKTCPSCAEAIEDAATRCPYCRAEVDGPGAGRRASGRPNAALIVGVSLVVVLVGIVGAALLFLPMSAATSDAATYQQIATIYQQYQDESGSDGRLSEELESIVERLTDEAGRAERAKQEMLWAARDYLLPMLGTQPPARTEMEEEFQTHMAMARQLIGDPSLPDLGGQLPEPAAE